LALLSPSPSPPTNKTIGRHEQSKKIIVMIDPGHGGEDPGAVGPTGAKRKRCSPRYS